MTWLLAAPVFVATPWVMFEVLSWSRLIFANHVERRLVRRRQHRAWVAIGVFELSVAFSITALAIQHHTAAATAAPAVGLVGVGFIVAGIWHPFERIFPDE